MSKIVLLAAALGAALLSVAPAEARQGPWCARVSTGSGSVQERCGYATFEACRGEVLAGNRGFCTQNPGWAGYYGMADAPRRRNRSVRYR